VHDYMGIDFGIVWEIRNNRMPISTLPATIGPDVVGQVVTGLSLAPTYFTDPDGDTLSFIVFAGSLPPGVSMSTSGVLTGTLTTAGNYYVKLEVADGKGGYLYPETNWIVNP
ncbi:MAG: putative Ig domain-containing protein, partial [Rhodoferax sp.]